MRVLFVKLSSMGDIFHSYSSVSDFCTTYPDSQIDWLVDSQFKEIAAWHQGVNTVFALPLRAYKRNRCKINKQALKSTLTEVTKVRYDLIVDAQGLLKSAYWCRKISTSFSPSIPIAGLSFASAREPLAALFYHRTFNVNKQQHAIVRTRQLLALSLNYFDHLQNIAPIGLTNQRWPQPPSSKFGHYGVIFPGTTWATKHWLDDHWQQLIDKLTNHYQQNIVIGWGNEQEYLRAQTLAAGNPQVLVPSDRLSMSEMAQWIAHSHWVIGVDTGFTHLASSMQKPVIGLFGPTSPDHTGVLGERADNIATRLPCFPCRKKYCKISKNKEIAQCMSAINDQLVIEKLINVVDLTTDHKPK